jgi:hypothetical protein
MSWQDLANGLFELCGGFMNWLNVYQIYKDKAVKGVNIWATVLFTAWGFWNLYYYPSLGQWASFVGGLVIVGANAVWVCLAFKYRRHS